MAAIATILGTANRLMVAPRDGSRRIWPHSVARATETLRHCGMMNIGTVLTGEDVSAALRDAGIVLAPAQLRVEPREDRCLARRWSGASRSAL